ncbi:MAG TPA: acyl-CoA dehydrogenase family protein [Spirochaetia bacterium]|nr:acyl-CoA dehydrogenase family protein [Spirochaetia bacterium]
MEFRFTGEQEMTCKLAQDFAVEEVLPLAREVDEKNYCPVEILKKMAGSGFNGVFVPQEYGGTGLGYVERAIVLEEMARCSAGIAMTLMTHHLGVASILQFGSEAQKQKYLPGLSSGNLIGGLAVTEPGGGSDVTGHQTTATREDGSWVLDGRKCFITNSHIADVVVITARTGQDEKGRPSLSAFIVEKGTPGFAPGREENKTGMHGSVTGELVLKDCRISEDALLGKEGHGQKIALAIISEVGRAGMSAISLGLLRAAIEESVRFARERIIYGKPLANIQAIQFAVAETVIEYEAAKLLTYRAVTLKDGGQRCDSEMAQAKYFATEAAVRAAKRTIDLMGGYGLLAEYPAERLLRDAMTTLPSAGTSNIMKIVVAANTLR